MFSVLMTLLALKVICSWSLFEIEFFYKNWHIAKFPGIYLEKKMDFIFIANFQSALSSYEIHLFILHMRFTNFVGRRKIVKTNLHWISYSVPIRGTSVLSQYTWIVSPRANWTFNADLNISGKLFRSQSSLLRIAFFFKLSYFSTVGFMPSPCRFDTFYPQKYVKSNQFLYQLLMYFVIQWFRGYIL